MKLTIIGLKPSQAQMIEREFDLLEFSFISSTDYKKFISPSNADATVLMTKFISHNQQEQLRGQPGVTYVNGGLSSLREVLSGLTVCLRSS